MTNVMERGDHLERHQQKELVGVSEEEEQYFIFFCHCFSALLPISFLLWPFFVSLFTPPFSSPATEKHAILVLMAWKIAVTDVKTR
jgi:hypothetical protein